MRGLQEFIYMLDKGKGARVIKTAAALLGFVLLAVSYDVRLFKNFSTQEAMDTAQLARNIADGKGYTTDFVRPLSIYLLQKHRPDHDPQLKTPHPDLANPPAYPYLLAGLMKVARFNFQIVDVSKRRFETYQPERVIAVFNQILFFVAALLLYFLSKHLFDGPVAVLSVVLLVGNDMFWRFTVSGLPTMLLITLFLAIVGLLVLLDEWTSAEEPRSRVGIAAAGIGLGLLLGIGALTRYSFGWLILPVLLFVALFGPRQKILVAILVTATFMACLAPWLARNHRLSGTWFGTAGFAVFQNTSVFQDSTLERSLKPDENLKKINFTELRRKLVIQAREILQTDLPRLGGSWLAAFFLVSLFIRFKRPALTRLKIFLIATLVLLVGVGALGRTYLSVDSPDLNSENLLPMAVPLAFIFGSALFFIVLDQFAPTIRELRYAVAGAFALVGCLPLIFNFMPPRTYPIAYPPYYPPVIQETASWLKEQEMMMSDMPWAVAWYGRRQCAWITLNYKSDFFQIHDDLKPVKGLYLTTLTTDLRLVAQMIKDRDGWGRFVLESYSRGEVMTGFPLTRMNSSWLPEQLFLTDWERWRRTK